MTGLSREARGATPEGYTGIQATLPNGVSDQRRFPHLSSTRTPISNSPAPCVCTKRSSSSSSTSGSHSRSCGCHLGVSWPGRSSSHTSSPSETSIGGSPTIALSSVATPANTLGGASTRRCAMLSAPFGCSVFDVGRVGTYCGENQASQRVCKQKKVVVVVVVDNKR